MGKPTTSWIVRTTCGLWRIFAIAENATIAATMNVTVKYKLRAPMSDRSRQPADESHLSRQLDSRSQFTVARVAQTFARTNH